MNISYQMLELCKSLQDQLNTAIPKAEKRLKRVAIVPEITVHNCKEFKTIAVFESLRSGEIYKVKKSWNALLDELQLTCDCKGWIYNQKCKHINYVKETPCGTIDFNSYDNPIKL